MAALFIRGQVVSVDTQKGISAKNQKEWIRHSVYVVNGGGAPECITIMNNPLTHKVGDKVQVEVRAQIFNSVISYHPVAA
jgi:hypothetical protein